MAALSLSLFSYLPMLPSKHTQKGSENGRKISGRSLSLLSLLSLHTCPCCRGPRRRTRWSRGRAPCPRTAEGTAVFTAHPHDVGSERWVGRADSIRQRLHHRSCISCIISFSAAGTQKNEEVKDRRWKVKEKAGGKGRGKGRWERSRKRRKSRKGGEKAEEKAGGKGEGRGKGRWERSRTGPFTISSSRPSARETTDVQPRTHLPGGGRRHSRDGM